jgi:glycosyltransferase involved in cell wall biosynthesis
MQFEVDVAPKSTNSAIEQQGNRRNIQKKKKLNIKIVVMMLTLDSEGFFKQGVLTSLKKALGRYDYNLVIVDGGSRDGTLEEISNVFGTAITKLVFRERNLALCRNLALKKAPKYADYYCWVDSDIIVPRNFFTRLIPLFKDKSVGTAEIRALLGQGNVKSIISKYYENLRGVSPTGVKEAEGGATTCLIMRSEIAQKVRADPRFKRAGEDVSIHYQVNEMGYKTIGDFNKPYARHVREPSFREEVRRLVQRGEARSLNIKLHKDVIRTGGVGKALLSSVITFACWILLFYGGLSLLIPFFVPAIPIPVWLTTLVPSILTTNRIRLAIAFGPILLLLARHAVKLKKPWKLHLAFAGLILSTSYLLGFMKGFLKYWVFRV